MPEGKKTTAPVPAPARDEDSYSAKTHLHQPVQETDRKSTRLNSSH